MKRSKDTDTEGKTNHEKRAREIVKRQTLRIEDERLVWKNGDQGYKGLEEGRIWKNEDQGFRVTEDQRREESGRTRIRVTEDERREREKNGAKVRLEIESERLENKKLLQVQMGTLGFR